MTEERMAHQTINEPIHIVSSATGNGMTLGPGFAQQHIEQILD